MEKQPQLHTIAPVYGENSRILILGSFPSVKSREAAFFYGHPQNRFWRVLAAVLGEEAPQTAAEKKSLLLRHGVALWDVIASCDIAGSSDASITNVVPNDLSRILDTAPVRRIFCNGGTSYRFYRRYDEAVWGKAEALPSRAAAVTEIMAELERVYPDLGYNPYSGVTIDFEGLRAADKESFNAFMTELSAVLHAEGKTLYAAVMPAVYGDAYFDGYDFKTLGTLCDRVILMAHDYAASDLTGFLGSRYYRNHPCAPLYKVYYAVRTAAREMDDPAKLTLAVSMDARAWQTDADGLLTAVRSTHPLQTTVYKRLCQSDTVMGWSDTARSPWCTYSTESGQHIFLWYEDARSTAEKLACARLVGVTSVSVWRLGLIPDYADEGLHYDVMSVL